MNASLSRSVVVCGSLLLIAAMGVNSWAQEGVKDIPTDDLEVTLPPPVVDGAVEPVIAIDTLDSINIESIGIQDEVDGGFGPDLWNDTRRTELESLLSLLPTSVQSSASHNLMKRLLISSSPVPIKTKDSKNLLEIRLQKLADLGEFSHFGNLLSAIPESSRTKTMRKIQGEVFFMQRDLESACSMASTEVQETSTPFWQKALCICQAISGNLDEALFSLNLLRELLGAKDVGFLELMSVLLGQMPTTTLTLEASALNLVLLIENGLAMPDQWLSEGGPAIQRSIALTEAVPLMTRLTAGERAAQMGALEPSELAIIYQKIVFEDNEFENANEIVVEKKGPWGRALLHQASRKKQLPQHRAKLLLESWKNSLEISNVIAIASTNMEAWLSLPVHHDIAFAAPTVIRALVAINSSNKFRNIQLDDGRIADEINYQQLLNNPQTVREGLSGLLVQAVRRGDKPAALQALAQAIVMDPHNPWLLKHLIALRLQLWLELLTEGAETDKEYDDWLISLRPILSIADIETPIAWQSAMAEHWWDNLPTEMDLGTRLAQASDLFVALHALGYSIGTSGWGLLRQGPVIQEEQVPNVGIRFGMNDASRSKRVGDTLLFTLIALGEMGISDAGPVALGSALRNLHRVGLTSEARVLALESFLHNGL